MRACGDRPGHLATPGAPATATTKRLAAAAADDAAARTARAAARLALARSPPSASAVRRASQRQQPTTADGVLREESDATRGWRTEELRWALQWFGSELDQYGYGDDARAALASRAQQDHTESTLADADASQTSRLPPQQDPLPLISGPWLFPDDEQGGDSEEAQQYLVSWPALFEVAWYPASVFFMS